MDSGATKKIEGQAYPDYPAMAEAYCHLVVSGQVSACSYIKLACRRYLTMLSPEFQEKHGIYFSPEHAIEACAFLETLHHIKGTKSGELFILEPWQMWMTCGIYGFRWAADGLRVVNTAYLEIPRKHGKSLWGAGICLYETTVLAGDEKGADLYIIAPKFDQGKKMLEPLQKMAGMNEDLTSFFGIKSTQKNSYVAKTDSQIVVLASLGEKQDGHDPKIIAADEFHAVPAEIYKVMKSAQRARPESLFLEIGSAGRHTFGIGWDERRASIDVLEGREMRLHVFAVIYTIDPEDMASWWTEPVIRKANPGLGISIDVRKTLQEAQDARKKPTDKVEFLRTALNLWGFSEASLFPKEKWDRSARSRLKIEMMKNNRGFLALDLASRNDMVAMVALFEEPNGQSVSTDEGDVPDVDLFAFAWYWVPELGAWIEDEDLVGPYRDWHASGHLTFTGGSRHRYGDVKAKVMQLMRDFPGIEMVVIDDQQANELYNALQDKEVPVQSFRKSAANFSDPTKDIMSRVNGEELSLFHDGNPVLGWNMVNVIGGPDTNDRILGKKPSPNSSQKIDGFDCLIMANAVRLQALQAPIKKVSASVERGMRKW